MLTQGLVTQQGGEERKLTTKNSVPATSIRKRSQQLPVLRPPGPLLSDVLTLTLFGAQPVMGICQYA